MKYCLLASIALFAMADFYNVPTTLSLNGAWVKGTGSTDEILIIQDGYLSFTVFDKTKKNFTLTRGGSIKKDHNSITLKTEFNSASKEKAGETVLYSYRFDKEELVLSYNGIEEKWTRIDDNTNALAGTWRISARMQGDKLNPVNPGARKTLKILSGTRFQWVAINTDTKEFFGTGGGIYTFKDGKYTENIEFFSRDSSRVGASLTFDGSVDNNVWIHKGMSSRGEPLYEEWTKIWQFN